MAHKNIKKIFLKFVFIFIILHCLSLGHTSNWINCDYHEIYPQVIETPKRILDNQNTSRVAKKLRTEITQILNFSWEPKNSDVKSFFSSRLSSREGFSAVINNLLEQKDEIKITDLNNHAVSKIFLGQYEETLQDCNSALAMPGISNNNIDLAYLNRGYVKSGLGQTKDAISDLEEGLKFKNFFSDQQL